MDGDQKSRLTYKVMIDYQMSLAEMIKLGEYDFVDEKITDNLFLIHGTGQHEVTLVLVCLDYMRPTDKVLEFLNKQGLEPAKIEHLLTLGALIATSQVQIKLPVVALGSSLRTVYGSICRYPILQTFDGLRKRKLDLLWEVLFWDVNWLFLAVDK